MSGAAVATHATLSIRGRVSPRWQLRWCADGPFLICYGVFPLQRCRLLWSAVASSIQGLGLRGYQGIGLQQGFAAGEMGFNINLQNGPCPLSSWLLSNSGCAVALPATDAAVLGTSALYGCQLPAQ